MKTLQPIVSNNGFAVPVIVNNETVSLYPGMPAEEARRVHANVLNYLSRRVMELTAPRWPYENKETSDAND